MTEASGSTGGLVASRNRGGAYFRKRTVPVNPNSTFQQTVRSGLAFLAAAWGNVLTAEQRAAWDAYALNVPIADSLGAPRNVGGLGMYVRSNVPRINAGLTRIDDAPTIFDVGEFTAPVVGTVDASASTLSLAFTETDAWVNEEGSAMIVQISAGQNSTINYFKGPYRFAGNIEGGIAPPTSPAVLTVPFPVAVGQRVFVEAKVSRADGRLSATFRGNGIVTA
jgi:hypothetical protein